MPDLTATAPPPGLTANQVALAWDVAARRVGLTANQAQDLLRDRRAWGKRLDGPDRDLDAEFGYIVEPTIKDYRDMYEHTAAGNRVVNLWPDECWGGGQSLYETEDDAQTPFEAAWEEASARCNLWSELHLADRLSRIGQYGVLLLGFTDGNGWERPPVALNKDGTVRDNAAKTGLAYVRAFAQWEARVTAAELDKANPRFGQALTYGFNFADVASLITGGGMAQPSGMEQEVHWSRVIHLAANRGSSLVYGTPQMRPVFPNLQNIRKVEGTSPEGYYRCGFPGYQFVTNPEMTLADITDLGALKDATKTEVEDYVNHLTRMLTAVGGEWKSMVPQVSPPGPHLDEQYKILCAAIGVPLPTFFGMQVGHLAGAENASTWKDRVRGHQTGYEEPYVVNPTVDRLIQYGVLPHPKDDDYITEWRDLKTLGEKDQADVGLKRAQAIQMYVTGKGWLVVPVQTFLTLCLNMTDDQAAAAVKAKGGEDAMIAELKKMAATLKPAGAAGGAGRIGSPDAGVGGNGRPPGVIAQP